MCDHESEPWQSWYVPSQLAPAMNRVHVVAEQHGPVEDASTVAATRPRCDAPEPTTATTVASPTSAVGTSARHEPRHTLHQRQQCHQCQRVDAGEHGESGDESDHRPPARARARRRPRARPRASPSSEHAARATSPGHRGPSTARRRRHRPQPTAATTDAATAAGDAAHATRARTDAVVTVSAITSRITATRRAPASRWSVTEDTPARHQEPEQRLESARERGTVAVGRTRARGAIERAIVSREYEVVGDEQAVERPRSDAAGTGDAATRGPAIAHRADDERGQPGRASAALGSATLPYAATVSAPTVLRQDAAMSRPRSRSCSVSEPSVNSSCLIHWK